MRASFAGFVFDSDTRQVFRAGQPLTISPKAFELLDLLIRNRPRALSKAEIHERLWPNVFVSDASLSNLVAELRSVLEDDARRPRVIRTVQRFGYAFLADARPATTGTGEGSTYRLLWESREIELAPGENVFGRDRGATVWIDDASVSRRHTRILVADAEAKLEDLGSKNGTFVNGRRIQKPVRLADGDRIRVGRANMVFRVLGAAGSTQTVSASRSGTKSVAPRR